MTEKQARAIAHHAAKYQLAPQMSTPPVFYFKDRTGQESTANITVLMAEYDRDRKAQRNKDKQDKKRS